MDPDTYFGDHYPKNIGRKQKFRYVVKHAIWMGNFTSDPVAYITVDSKKVPHR